MRFFSTYDSYVKFSLRIDLFKQVSPLEKTCCGIVQELGGGTRVTRALLSVGSLLPVTQARAVGHEWMCSAGPPVIGKCCGRGHPEKQTLVLSKPLYSGMSGIAAHPVS